MRTLVVVPARIGAAAPLEVDVGAGLRRYAGIAVGSAVTPADRIPDVVAGCRPEQTLTDLIAATRLLLAVIVGNAVGSA